MDHVPGAAQPDVPPLDQPEPQDQNHDAGNPHQPEAGPEPRRQRQGGRQLDSAAYLVAAAIVVFISYFLFTTWSSASGGGVQVDDLTPAGREDAVHVVINMKISSSFLNKIKTWCVWLILYILVMNSAPRMFVSAGQQVRAMVPPGSSLSTIIWNDELAGLMYSVALGFVTVGLNNVILGYLHDNTCHLGDTPRVYLPFKDREDVKVALRAWGSLLHNYVYLVAGLVKSGVRPAMSNVQYAVLGLTVTGLCTWDLLRSSCVSNAAYKHFGFYALMACECLWVVGRRTDLIRGDKQAYGHLLWHLSVLVTIRWAPV